MSTAGSPLNGSLGEIYRNFFYMPDRPSSTGAVISTFYSRFMTRRPSSRFDGRHIVRRWRPRCARPSAQIPISSRAGKSKNSTRSSAGVSGPGATRRSTMRFGPMFFLPGACSDIDTAKIPLSFENLDRSHDQQDQQPPMASYPSDCGFAGRTTSVQVPVKEPFGTQRPCRSAQAVISDDPHRAGTTDRGARTSTCPGSSTSSSRSCKLFNIEQVNSATQYGLIATLEYLGQRYDLEISEDQVTSDHG